MTSVHWIVSPTILVIETRKTAPPGSNTDSESPATCMRQASNCGSYDAVRGRKEYVPGAIAFGVCAESAVEVMRTPATMNERRIPIGDRGIGDRVIVRS